METSDALDLQKGVFKLSPKKMASSLKRSAERSSRRKSAPLRSAMSMLSFYENRAGRKLPASRKRKVAQAKQELRRLFGKERSHRACAGRRPGPVPSARRTPPRAS